MIGGGIGVPAYAGAAKEADAEVTISIRLRSADLFLVDELEAAGRLFITTEDGSVGTKGNVMDAIRENHMSRKSSLPAARPPCCGL